MSEQPIAAGMTLRDWFAAMATDADIDSILRYSGWKDGQRHLDQIPTRQQARYTHADAMLAARDEREHKESNNER